MADVGCRNTVFGAEAQSDPNSIKGWRNAGITNFRVEFVHQMPRQVTGVVEAFGEFFANSHPGESAEKLAELLREFSPQDTTQGSLYVPGDFKDLVQLG